MITTLVRYGLLATLVGGSTVALVGSDQARLYLETGKRAVFDAIDEAQGLEGKLEVIKTQIARLDSDERELKEDAIENAVELESLRREVAQRQASIEKQAALLERVSEMLGDGETTYVIGGRKYGRAEVETDAAEKLAVFEVQKETLKNLEETLSTKEKAQTMAAENVGRATALRADLRAQVALLEAKLEKFRAKQNFAATVEDVIDTRDIDSSLARARERIADFHKQLEVKDRLLDERLKAGKSQPERGIDYEGESEGAKDVASRIRSALEERGGAAPQVSVAVAIR
jgi:hypothetical protein